MNNPADANIVVCTNMSGIARTLRMALRGMGVRNVVLAANTEQLLEGFTAAKPHCVITYVESENSADDGLTTLNFIRRSEDSPHSRIPVIAVSPRRDLQTINAVINGGAGSTEPIISAPNAASTAKRSQRPSIGPSNNPKTFPKRAKKRRADCSLPENTPVQ